MKITRASKETKAFWRSERKLRRQYEAEKPVTKAEKAYGQYRRTCERLWGHAAGWVAGVAWARRNLKIKAARKETTPSSALLAAARPFNFILAVSNSLPAHLKTDDCPLSRHIPGVGHPTLGDLRKLISEIHKPQDKAKKPV